MINFASNSYQLIAPLKKIIVCLGHSSLDRDLIINACELSKIAGTEEITFLNVIKEFNLPEAVQKEFPDLITKAIEERKTEIDQLVEVHFQCTTKTNTKVLQGSETREILKVANDSKADLVIIGKKNNSESVLGTRIARRSPCSLLVIPEDTELRFDRVFIPVDFSDYSILSLQTILSMTDELSSKIYLHNVFSVPSSYRYSGKSYEEFSDIIKGHSKKDLDHLIKEVKTNNQVLEPVFTIDKGENTIDLVLREAEKKKVDLIVIGAKGRTAASALLIGSKAERMIRINNSTPMMIVRRKGAAAGILETLKETLD